MSTSNPVLLIAVFLVGYNALLVVPFLLMVLIMVAARPFASRRPPPVGGCGAATFRRCLQLFRWGLTGVSYGMKRGPWPGRFVSAVLLVILWVFAPALVATQFYAVARPWTRYYFSPTGDAVLAVIGHRGRWAIADHLSSAPGTGQGRTLREVLLPELVTYADHHQLPVTTTAAAPALAEQYATALPGLRDIAQTIQLPHTSSRPPAAVHPTRRDPRR
jgi:hypothetical protein